MANNPRLSDWHGRLVWVLGGSTGIGRATALALCERGARVMVSARQAEPLQQLAALHPGLHALPLDATDAAAVRAAAIALRGRHGPLDLVMYCAGHYRAMRASSFNLDDALRHQQVNYVGALHLLDAVLPALQAQAAAGQPAHLSLVASVAGYRGLPMSLAYGPTKAALINLAESLYLDLAPKGIGVSLINPGFVDTPLTAQNRFHMPALITPEQAAQAILAGWAEGRFEIHFPKRFTRALKLLRSMPDALYFRAVGRVAGS